MGKQPGKRQASPAVKKAGFVPDEVHKRIIALSYRSPPLTVSEAAKELGMLPADFSRKMLAPGRHGMLGCFVNANTVRKSVATEIDTAVKGSRADRMRALQETTRTLLMHPALYKEIKSARVRIRSLNRELALKRQPAPRLRRIEVKIAGIQKALELVESGALEPNQAIALLQSFDPRSRQANR